MLIMFIMFIMGYYGKFSNIMTVFTHYMQQLGSKVLHSEFVIKLTESVAFLAGIERAKVSD